MSWWTGIGIVERQENFSVSAGFELITHGLLVQEHNYSATTHNESYSSEVSNSKCTSTSETTVHVIALPFKERF